MKDELHTELIEHIDTLRKEVSTFSSSSILGAVALLLRPEWGSGENVPRLLAPARQCFFLLQITYQTEEPEKSSTLGEAEVERLVTQLGKIFDVYARMYFPEKEEVGNLPESWYESRTVIMPYFLTYFTQPALASVEQVERRIVAYIGPFTDTVQASTGLSVLEILACMKALAELLQENADRAVERMREMKAIWETWRRGDDRDIPDRARDVGRELHESIEAFFVVPTGDLAAAVGEDQVGKFLELFRLSRNSKDGFVYPTDRYTVEDKPLFTDERGRTHCPSANALYLAALRVLEVMVESKGDRAAYLAHRDKCLESQVESQFRRIIATEATVLSNVCETPQLQFEHDLVIQSGRILYIVEIKASPPREPFRDADKAITRVRDHFRSDSGPQKAFEQANALRKRMRSGEVVTLYREGGPVISLTSSDFDQIFCVCITRDSYGPLATSLNLLLGKPEHDPYPWIIDFYSLEQFIDGFTHFGLGEAELVRYLSDRISLHGKVFGADELEFAGFFLRHDSLRPLTEAEAGFVQLGPEYSDIFDDVYTANASGQQVERVVKAPVMRSFLAGETSVSADKSPGASPRSSASKRSQKEKNRKRMAKQSKRRNRR